MNLSEVIREISVDLNDQEPGHEYTRWSVDQLQIYVREGLTIVGRTLKDLFTDEVIVKVSPGAGWQSACDCTLVHRIVGETDKYGNILRYLTRSLDKEENTWPGPVQKCPEPPKDYVMTGYTTSSTDEKKFKIVPPVPVGIDRYVLVECYRSPTSTGLDESVPDEAIPIIKQWVIYRALSIDSENNPTIINLAQTHRKSFDDLLQLAVAIRKQEQQDDDNLRAIPKSPPQQVSGRITL